MKFWKHTLITAAAFIGISSSVLYTSCVKDSCERLHCKNGAVCNDEVCQCKTGYEGTECELMIANRYVGNYDGSTKCNEMAPNIDSAIVIRKGVDKIAFRIYAMGVDTNTYTVTVDATSGRFSDPATGVIVDVIDEADRITIREQTTVNGKASICTFIGSKRN
ncbi:MAG: hypothetical protein EOP51_03575 [Sphingobacteriales bacterium]|nr:MAG: hypothetical protein EOP51_03575 [Sphingobacteriales bacterium]